MTSIADPSSVRAAGALLTSAKGGASDEQLNGAIPLAQQLILSYITESDYIAMRDYAGADADTIAMKAAFALGESRFAVGFLPSLLLSAQLEQTGFKTQSTIGRATTTFGNPVDISAIDDFWRSEGMKAIEAYLDLSYTDPDKDSDDDGFTVGQEAGPVTMISI